VLQCSIYLIYCRTAFGKWLRKYRLHLYPRRRGNNISIERVHLYIYILYTIHIVAACTWCEEGRPNNAYTICVLPIHKNDGQRARRNENIERYINKNNNKSTFLLYIYTKKKESGGRCLKVGGTIGPYHAPLDRPRR